MESNRIVEIMTFKENGKRLLGRLLNKSYRYVSEIATEFLREKGFSGFRVGHIIALIHIDSEGVTVNTLALRAGITKQGMSKVVKELVDGGYVISEKHPSDARSIIVRLTERGYQVLVHWKECTELIDEKFTEIVGTERLEQVKDILQILVEHYESNHDLGYEKNVMNKIMFGK